MLIKVENQKTKEKEKLEKLPAELGITLEEYENFDPTTQNLETSSVVNKVQKPSSEENPSWTEPGRVDKRRISQENQIIDSSKRPRRSAATAAAGLMTEMILNEGL